MMAVEDDGICPTHEKNPVALYCKTCEVLICTRCVSHGSQSSARHRHHVYLDLGEAYDMLQEDVEQLTSGLRQDLQEKRKQMQSLQAKLQRLQISLLRKKTQLGKSTRSLKETVKKQEKSYMCGVENLISPAIITAQQQYNDVEYEVISGEGLLASGEALEQTPKERLVSFLRNVSHVKKEFEEMRSKTFTTYTEDTEACQKFTRVNLNLHREKYLLDRAFTFTHKVPSAPQPLQSWCVIGQESASLVWKFNHKTDIVKCFNVYYKQYADTDKDFIKTKERVKTIIQRVKSSVDESDGCQKDINLKSEPSSKTSIIKESNSTDSIVPARKAQTAAPQGGRLRKEGCQDDNGIERENADRKRQDQFQFETSSNYSCHSNYTTNWFGLSWLFGTTKKESNRLLLDEDCEEQTSKGQGSELSDGVVSDKSDEIPQSEKTSVQEEALNTSNIDRSNARDNNTEIDDSAGKEVQPRSQSSYVDPCEFWKEMQLNSSTEAFVNPYNNSSEKNQHQNKNYCSNATTKGVKTFHSPEAVARSRRSSTSSAIMAPSADKSHQSVVTSPASHTQRRVRRVHSLEPPKNVVSPLLSKQRSQTPTKHVPPPQYSKQRASVIRSPSPCCNTGHNRKNEGSKLATAASRMSRRDQPFRGKSVLGNGEKITKKPTECTENAGDENIKDRFNEKTHSVSPTKNATKEVKRSAVLIGKEPHKKDDPVKRAKRNWQKNNMCIIHDESEESCPTETDDTSSDKQTTDTSSSYRKRSNTYTKDDTSQSPDRSKREKKPNRKKVIKRTLIKSCTTEYASVKSMASDTMQGFKQFKISRFVLGRVHATLQDLETDSNYIVLVTAENQCGESDAAVIHFKTGSSQEDDKPLTSVGHMIKGVQGHRKSWRSIFSSALSKVSLYTFLVLYMFLVFYLIATHVQNSICSHLTKENSQAVSELCLGVVPEELCLEQFKSNSIQYCDDVMRRADSKDFADTENHYDNPLNWFLRLFNLF